MMSQNSFLLCSPELKKEGQYWAS